MLPKLIFPGSSSSLPADVLQVFCYDLVLDLQGERVQGLGDEDGVPGAGAGGVGRLGRNQRRRGKTSRVETGERGRGQIIQSLTGCVRDSRLYPETSGETVKALKRKRNQVYLRRDHTWHSAEGDLQAVGEWYGGCWGGLV